MRFRMAGSARVGAGGGAGAACAACADAGRASGSADAAGQAESALGSYLAARHAAGQHDYADAAHFIERALVGDPDNLRSGAPRLRAARCPRARSARRCRWRAASSTSNRNPGSPGSCCSIEEIKDDKFDEAARLAAAMPREGAERFAVPLLDAWIEAGRQNPKPRWRRSIRSAACAASSS